MDRINPLNKEVTASVENEKVNLKKFAETARVRPNFSPQIQPMYKQPAIKNGVVDTDDFGNEKYLFINGTYFDLLRLPTNSARNISNTEMNKMRNAIRSISVRNTKKEQGTGPGKGRKASVPISKYSTLAHFSDLAYRLLEAGFTAAVPEDIRVRSLETDTLAEQLKEKEKEVDRKRASTKSEKEKEQRERKLMLEGQPRDFFKYFHDTFTDDWNKKQIPMFSQKVRVKGGGGAFKVALPIASRDLSNLTGELFNKSALARSEYSVPVLKIIDALKDIFKLNLRNKGSSSVSLSYNEFINAIPQAYRTSIPNLDKAISKYVDGIRIEIGPVKQDKNFEKHVRDLQKDIETFELTDDLVDGERLAGSYFYKEALNALATSFMSRSFTFYLETTLPATEAQFFTQTPKDKVRAVDVLEFFRSVYGTYWLPVVEYYYPVEEIAQKNVGFQPNPKSNGDGLCINSNNELFYIPNVNNIDRFTALRNTELFDEATGEYVFEKSDAGIPLNLRNYLVYTDWVNNKLVYTNRDGKITVLDIENMNRIRPHAVVSLLDSNPSILASVSNPNLPSPLVTFGNACDAAYSQGFTNMLLDKAQALLAETQNAPINRKVAEELLGSLRDRAPINEFIQVAYKAEAFRLYSLEGMSADEAYANAFKNSNADDDGLVPFQRKIASVGIREFMGSTYGKMLAETLDFFVDKILSNLQNFIQASGLNSIRFALSYLGLIIALKNYKGRYTDFKMLDQKEREIYLKYDVKDGDPTYVAKLPNVATAKDGEGRMLKNFQWRALSLLDKSPEYSILAVDAGGGKTISIIANILQELQKKKVTRPLVICPSHLVKDYVGEINYLCTGKVNAVVITNDTIKSYTKNGMLSLIEKAPINTVFITSYDAFTVGADFNLYCNEVLEDYRHLDFFRQAAFDGVWLDESHYLKNKSTRFYAVSYAIAEIPLKRLATGTLAPNRLKDIVNQFALFDPTVFGSVSQFEKLVDASPGEIPQVIMEKLKGHCTFINIKRREWAAELPTRIQSFDPVVTIQSEKQKLLYRALLNDAAKEALNDDLLKNEMDKTHSEASENDEDSDERPDDMSQDEVQHLVTKQLDKHLAHIELFLSAPMAHPIARLKVDGKPYLSEHLDQMSPKVPVVEYHYRDHMDFIRTGVIWERDENGNYAVETYKDPVSGKYIPIDNGHGGKVAAQGFRKEDGSPDILGESPERKNKVLVFTNWKESVEEIFRFLAPDIKARTMKYYASDKVRKFNEFRDNDHFMMMIGIGKSMNTGLNLQFCSRLILLEAVWAPGDLEQSLARVFRPVKLEIDANGNRKPDPRKRVFINHVIVDETIDIFKTGNLISKWVQITKTMNADNPLYDKIPEVPEIRLSLKNLFGGTEGVFVEELENHKNAFLTLLAVEHEDFRTFKLNNPDKLEVKPIENAPNLEGSAILDKVPYVPGMSIYNDSDDLDLIPYNEWKRQYMLENDGHFNLEEIVAAEPVYIHCELGDGFAIKEGSRKTKKAKKADSDLLVEEDEAEDEAFDSDFDINVTEDQIRSGNLDWEKIKDNVSNIVDDDDTEEDVKDDKKKNVRVRFYIDDSTLTKEELNILRDSGEDVDIKDITFSISMNPDKLFVIAKNVSSKRVRDIVIEQIEGIDDVTKTGLAYQPYKKATDPAYQETKLKAAIEKLKKRVNRHTKRLEEEEAERKNNLKEATREADQEKRGRGRPRKTPVDEIKPEDIMPESTEHEHLTVNVSQAFGFLALTVSAEHDASMKKLNSLITHSEFFDIGPYYAVPVSASKFDKLAIMIDNISPLFNNGVPILKDSPIIKNPVHYIKKGKFYVNKLTGNKIDAEAFEAGEYVNKAEKRPKFNLEDNVYGMLANVEESFDLWVKRKQLKFARGKVNDEIQIRRNYKKKSKPDELRMFTLFKRATANKYGLFLCVPTKTNAGGAVSWFKQKAKAEGASLPVIKESGMYVALYPMGKKADLTADLNSLKENFKIDNKDEIKEDLARLKVPGRKPS